MSLFFDCFRSYFYRVKIFLSMINFYKKIGLEFLFKILCNVNIKKLYIINHNIQYYFENSN